MTFTLPQGQNGQGQQSCAHCARCVLWPLWRCDCDVKACCTIMCALKQSCAHCARCVLLTHCDVWLWRQGLLQPGVTGSSALQDEVTHYRRVSCAVSLDPGNGSLYPGGHFCPSPVNSRLFTDDYSRLPRIAGSSLNHMIRNCPTTSQETFNDGYNNFCSLAITCRNPP